MRIGITAYPNSGYELFFRQNMCVVRMYKNPETITENGEERNYADVVNHTLYFDDMSTVEPDVIKNFDYYFEVEKEKELVELRQKKLEELKEALFASALQSDFATVKAAIDNATSEDALNAIKVS